MRRCHKGLWVLDGEWDFGIEPSWNQPNPGLTAPLSSLTGGRPAVTPLAFTGVRARGLSPRWGGVPLRRTDGPLACVCVRVSACHIPLCPSFCGCVRTRAQYMDRSSLFELIQEQVSSSRLLWLLHPPVHRRVCVCVCVSRPIRSEMDSWNE